MRGLQEGGGGGEAEEEEEGEAERLHLDHRSFFCGEKGAKNII